MAWQKFGRGRKSTNFLDRKPEVGKKVAGDRKKHQLTWSLRVTIRGTRKKLRSIFMVQRSGDSNLFAQAFAKINKCRGTRMGGYFFARTWTKRET